MSATQPGPTLDIVEQIARIMRAQEKTRKFAEEQHKLAAEAAKLGAETAKLGRDRYLSLWLAIAAVIGGFSGLVATSLSFWRATHS